MTALLSRASMLAAATAAMLALTACGDSSTDENANTTPAAAPPATTADATPPAATEPEEGDDGTTGAGETQPLGTRVVAPYVVYGKGADKQTTKLGVTVQAVRKGKISDFKDFNLDAKQKQTTPYYVIVKYENLGNLRLERFLLDPSIEDSDGDEYKPLNLIVLSGTFNKCPNPAKAKLQPGKSFKLCAPILLPKGKTYERVRFQGDVLKDPYFWK
jgi:hypothetical protein